MLFDTTLKIAKIIQESKELEKLINRYSNYGLTCLVGSDSNTSPFLNPAIKDSSFCVFTIDFADKNIKRSECEYTFLITFGFIKKIEPKLENKIYIYEDVKIISEIGEIVTDELEKNLKIGANLEIEFEPMENIYTDYRIGQIAINFSRDTTTLC